MTTTDDRDQALRALLVDRASRPVRPKRRTALIAVLAFLLGGGLATGAVSVAVAATRAETPVSVQPQAFEQILEGGELLGALVTFTGSSEARLDLGPRPAGATGIIFYLQCGDGRGNIRSITLGGKPNDAMTLCTTGSGYGTTTEQGPTDSRVTVTTDGTFPYAVWAQWYAAPAPVTPSAAQRAATADGKITSAELHSAVDRFVACMVGAGHPVSNVTYEPTPSFAYNDGADSSGAIRRCEDAELTQVSTIWSAQGDHE